MRITQRHRCTEVTVLQRRVKNSGAASQHGSVVGVGQHIGKSKARTYVLLPGIRPRRVAVAIRAEDQRTGQTAGERIGGRIAELRRIVIRLMPRNIDVVADTQVQRQLRVHLHVVFKEARDVIRVPARVVVINILVGVIQVPQFEARKAVAALELRDPAEVRHIGFAAQEAEVGDGFKDGRVLLMAEVDPEHITVPALLPGHDVVGPDAVVDIVAVVAHAPAGILIQPVPRYRWEGIGIEVRRPIGGQVLRRADLRSIVNAVGAVIAYVHVV